MLKAKAIIWVLRAVVWLGAVGVGVWYLSASIGGGAITYASLPGFLSAIGACPDGVCDIASANGCFLCPYVERLFLTIGTAAEDFWNALVANVWIIMAAGFGIFLFIQTFKHLIEASKKNAALDTSERSLDWGGWFDKIWRQGVRVMIAGAFMGALGLGGHAVLKTVSNITITPVMYLGTELAMAATGVSDAAQCGDGVSAAALSDNAIGPALKPFMCVIGNLNTVVLAGASGGFSLMNFAWMDMGGGMFTWIAGLALVLLFLYIGFKFFFDILTVIFQLVFLIIFLPLIIAAWAFEGTWDLARGVVSGAVGMLANCAVRVISIALQVLILYAAVSFAADEYFPGPVDGYSAILPPGMVANADARQMSTGAAQTASVAVVFAKCERAGTANGAHVMDKNAFRECFVMERQRAEGRYPGSFDFMTDGLAFMMLMIGLYFAYEYVVKKEIEGILSKGSDGKFKFGDYVRDFGQAIWDIPKRIGDAITKGAKK